ncbi:MAG: O-antigen ligase family protein [Candidatus Obscuribacterales bacterium]|nr:O-antigen ligase family protein [Candidatus Obscuribacterales bacterium]
MSANTLRGLVDELAIKLSLWNMDQAWHKTLTGSLFLKPFCSAYQLIQKSVPPQMSNLGSLLQFVAYCLSVMLFALIGLPQFANDKYGLAIVVIAGLALWIVGRLMGGKERRKFDSFDAIVLAYLAANIVAAFASHYFGASLKGLSKIAIYIGSYFLFSASFAYSMKRKMAVVMMALLCGTALSLYGLYQYKIGVAPLATWEDPSIEGSGTRIFATLGNPNLLAGVLVPLAPIAFALGLGALIQSFSGHKQGKPAFIATGVIFVGIGALISIATLLTQSRGSYLGLLASCGVILYIGTIYLWINFKKIRPVVIGGIVVLLIGLVVGLKFVPAVSQRFESIFAGREHSSNSYRLNVYASSFRMFKDNWWIGTGPGNEAFRLSYGLYMVSSYDALGTYCVPLEVAVETGIPGLLAFIALVVCTLSRAHVKFWSSLSTSSLSKWLAAGLSASLIGLMIHGLVDTVFYRPQVHFLFWLIVALIISPDEKDVEAW